MVGGEPQLDLTLSKGEEEISYAGLMSELHDIMKAKNGKPLTADEIRLIKNKLEAFTPNEVVDSEDQLSKNLKRQLKQAREILGKENVLGPQEFVERWKSPWPQEVLDIPYSVEELKRAESAGMCLVFRPNKINVGGEDVSYPNLKELCEKAHEIGINLRWGNEKWDDISKRVQDSSSMLSGWVLISKDIVPGTKKCTTLDRSSKIWEFATAHFKERFSPQTENVLPEFCLSVVDLLYYYVLRGKENIPGILTSLAYDRKEGDFTALVDIENDGSILVYDYNSFFDGERAFIDNGCIIRWSK